MERLGPKATLGAAGDSADRNGVANTSTPNPFVCLTTSQVADQLGVHLWRIFNALRARKLRPPAKCALGAYWWGEEDIAALQKALATDGRHERKRRRLEAQGVEAG
jgi:hypothetical protein